MQERGRDGVTLDQVSSHAADDLRLERLIRRVMCNSMEIAFSAATAKDIHMITNHDLGRDIIYDMANGRKNTAWNDSQSTG